jgi:hypothetical protein
MAAAFCNARKGINKMATNPKQVEEKFDNVSSAWENLAKSASFAKLSLSQYKGKVQAATDARKSIKDLQDQLAAANAEREFVDRDVLEASQLVVNAVKGDPDYGVDSPLYEAMGYVRKSARKSGLKRNAKSKVTTPA